MAHDHEQCRKLLSSLSAYVDGDLEDVICAEIDRHMAGCENCRIVVDTLRKTIYLYQVTTESTNVPLDVKERLFDRLELDAFLPKHDSPGPEQLPLSSGQAELRQGDICPNCGQGTLAYDGLLNLSCPACGFNLAGCFT